MNNRETTYGLLVHYDYCTGCHSCEVACKKELNLSKGQFGIKVLENGPCKTPDGKWEWSYVPMLTNLCDMCKVRVNEGKLPNCVHHCQAWCMEYGPVEELAKKMGTKGRATLLVPHQP